MFGDARVGVTMGGVRSRDEVAQMLEESEATWDERGVGYWMFHEAATGAPVARGGLKHPEFDRRPEVEVAWMVTPEGWGEGFATEFGAASVEVAFGPLELPDVVAFTLPHNAASRRVMEKLGFTYEKTAPFKIFGDHVLYRRAASGGEPARSAS